MFVKCAVFETMHMNSGNFNIGVIESPKLADDTNIEAFLVANELPIKTDVLAL